MKLEIHGSESKLEKPSVPCCQQDEGQNTTLLAIKRPYESITIQE